MQTNNYFDLIISSLFLGAVITIGLPLSCYLLKKGVEGFIKYRFSKLPKNYLIFDGFGIYSIQIIFYGLFLLSGSIWVLFFDKGGQLAIYVNQVKAFMGI